MDATFAKLTLLETVKAPRWRAFTDWLEEGDETGHCAHDQSDYEDWFRAQGDDDVERAANAVWDALGVISPGHCRCNAGSGIWTGKELDGVLQPIVYARGADLPRLLTGLPETPSAAQTATYDRFYGAYRVALRAFWDAVPEPAFDGDMREGMGFATALAKLAALNPGTLPMVHGSMGQMRFFFHSGAFEDVKAYFERAGHPLIPLTDVFDTLAVYVARDADDAPVPVEVMIGDTVLSQAVQGYPHIVVVNPETERLFAGKRWHDVAEVTLRTPGGDVHLADCTPGLQPLRIA